MDTPSYRVVMNDEEQYSIWAEGRPAPAGWRDTGVGGTKEECLAHVETVWVDMRPRSIRGDLRATPTEPEVGRDG